MSRLSQNRPLPSSPEKISSLSVVSKMEETQKSFQRLDHLASTFTDFYQTLNDETRTRKNADEKRLARIEQEIKKTETALNHEQKRRIEAAKNIQIQTEEQLEQIKDKFKSMIHDAYAPLQAQVDALVQRVEACEQSIASEVANRDAQIQQSVSHIIENFETHSKQFEIEKVTRMQRESLTLKRVGDEVFRMEQKVAAERLAREAALTQMKDEFWVALEARIRADEKFKADMERSVSVVERRLESETSARLECEDSLSRSVAEYAHSMRAGIESIHLRSN